MYFDKIEEDYKKKGLKLYSAPDEFISKLLEKWKILPRSYVEFLKIMGSGTEDGFMAGESIFADELLNLKEWGIETMQDCGSIHSLKETDFVFWMSQGIMFAYFNVLEGDDPPVYFFNENEPTVVKKITNHFSDFLLTVYHNRKSR